jgi:hypothetical protein
MNKQTQLRTLTINCFNFTLGATGIINDGTTITIPRADALHIFKAAKDYQINKVNLIGPSAITQRIIQELITDYSYFEVQSVLG